MGNYTRVLKIAPAFLLFAGTMLHAQAVDTLKTAEIEQVVLIGYGKQKKSDLVGSVTAVSEKEFNKGAIVSADQLINGKAPGVRIASNGGSPDSPPNIRIRGGASLSASNNPLIVIDGIALDSNNAAGSGNPLNLINPNDIESFSILKDATATAIYGNRASNGVIIIKTKRGGGKLKINFNTNVQIGEVTKFIDVMNAEQFTSFINANYPKYRYRLGAGGDVATPNITGQIFDTNWQKEIYRTTVSSDNNLSISGKLFKSTPTRLSLGYNRTEGVVKTSDYERFTAGLNLSPVFFDKHLKVDVSLKGIYSKFNAIDEGGAIGGALTMDPTKPIYLNQTGLSGEPYNRFAGYYQDVILNGGQYKLNGASNPLAILNQRTSPSEIYKFLGNAELDYKLHFFPDVRAVVNLGLETSTSNLSTVFSDNAIATYRNLQDKAVPNDYRFNPGVDYLEKQTVVNQTMDAYLVYEKNYSGLISNFLLQGGYSYQNFKNDGYKDTYEYVGGFRVPTEKPRLNPSRRYFNELNLQSFIGRSNVAIANKYLFTFTLRADATSLYKKDNRWGYFPAVGFAWKINEDLFKEASKVKELKLRLGWGRTGQANITGIAGFYPSRQLFGVGSANSQYFPGIGTYSALPFNPNLTWETTETYNAGLDFTFFRNERITGSIDLYKRNTTNLLALVPIPTGQSLTNEFADNVGSLENKGIEAGINFIPVKTEDFTWSLGGNAAYNEAVVTDLENVNSIVDNNSTLPFGTGIKLAYNTVGQAPYSAWVFQQVYDTNGIALPEVYVDRNGDGKITNGDRYYQELRPKWTYGFNTTANYKNWDINGSFRGQIGGMNYNTRNLAQGFREFATPQDGQNLNNVLASTATSPFVKLSDNTYYSDYFLENASFLKLDNVSIGYLIKNFIKDANVRIYGSVTNVYTWTKYTGQDPENFSSIDNNFYPRPRIYTLGFNFNF